MPETKEINNLNVNNDFETIIRFSWRFVIDKNM